MERKLLQELFCEKITLELQRFKNKMIKQRPEVIYEKVYQIDSMINIYECLLEQSQKISEQALASMLVFPNLLVFLYSEWLDYEDSYAEELNDCMSQCIEEIGDVCRQMSGKEGKAA